MALSRPRRILIGAHWYTVQYIPEEKVNGKFVGLCFQGIKVIKVAAKLPKRMIAQTLLHEVMHAIYYEYGLTNSEMSDEVYAAGMNSEENCVNVLSLGITTVFAVNPKFAAFIMQSLK